MNKTPEKYGIEPDSVERESLMCEPFRIKLQKNNRIQKENKAQNWGWEKGFGSCRKIEEERCTWKILENFNSK